jgi:hypothetical protein
MGVRTKITYTKALAAAAASVRYYAFRTREVEKDQVGIFDRASDHADVKRFVRNLDDPLTADKPGRPPRFAKIHRVLFTMSGAEFRRWGLTSWQPIVREAIANFEQRHGMKLDWVAAEHPSPGHPHCHVAIKSVCEDKDGDRHRLRITPDLRRALWEEAQRVVTRHKEHTLALEREERDSDDLARSFIHDLVRASREAHRQHELERQRQRERDFRGR